MQKKQKMNCLQLMLHIKNFLQRFILVKEELKNLKAQMKQEKQAAIEAEKAALRAAKEKAEDIFAMISGTHGLFGAADGAFVMYKEKRTAKTATLAVSGRDQPDQKLFLVRNEERLIWELDKVETELWKENPDPLLEAIAEKITADNPVWEGSISDFRDFLPTDITPIQLGMKLNVTAGRLLNEYNILYESRRTHAGRRIKFVLQA